MYYSETACIWKVREAEEGEVRELLLQCVDSNGLELKG